MQLLTVYFSPLLLLTTVHFISFSVVVHLTTSYSSGARIRAAGAMATKFCTVAPVFVCPQYGTGFMSPFWGPDSRAGSRYCQIISPLPQKPYVCVYF